MKSKHTTENILDKNFIKASIDACINSKNDRVGLARWIAKVNNLTKSQVEYIIHQRFQEPRKYNQIIYPIVDMIYDELLHFDITFEAIKYKEGFNVQSGKVRKIGTQHPKQCFADHIVVRSIQNLAKRIGEFQVATIPKRGQLYGANKIKNWLKERSNRYFIKMDIQKCYESIDSEKLLSFLSKHIKNPTVYYLIEQLIKSYGGGLSIGSYLSQWCCNIYLSQLYHFVKENLFSIRKKKNGTVERVSYVKHALFYMDDILIMGSNKKHLLKAADEIVKFTKDMLRFDDQT